MNEAFDLKKADIIETHPWPATSILNFLNFHSGQWGFLIIFKDPTRESGINFYFDGSQKPTEDQVNQRWSDRFELNRKKLANQI